MESVRRLETLGPYSLGQRLGLGGMAEVFAGQCAEFGRVALKRILPTLAQDREFSEMFWDEARITSRIEHPNVVKVLDYGRIDDQLYMALEYVDGPSTAKLLRRAASKKIHLSVPVVLSLATQLLGALGAVHDARDHKQRPLGIVHRDVSPGNIMINSLGQVKLGDFGIVRSEVVMRRTQPGELKGKIGYMSPEQAVGGPLDQRSDLFSVGVVLAELLILRPLLLGKNEMQTLSRTVQADLSTWHRFNDHVPLSLRDIVERALDRSPKRRFESAAQMRQALVDLARIQGWPLEQALVSKTLVQLGFLEAREAVGTHVSGERPATNAGTARRRPALGSVRPIMATRRNPSGEHVIRPLGAAPRFTGEPVWRLPFHDLNLPYHLFRALKKTRDGGVELSRNGWSTTIEIRDGRIVASHDSAGIAPIGRLLLEAGVLGGSDLARAIGESRRAELRLGEFLVMKCRLRESTLQRLLHQQTMLRLKPWFEVESGYISIFAASPLPSDEQSTDSMAQVVGILREALSNEALVAQLSPVIDAIMIPASSWGDPAELGMTSPELRVLQTTLAGGAFEGRSPRYVMQAVTSERLARHKEAAFALFIGLCAGLLHAPGFGHD